LIGNLVACPDTVLSLFDWLSRHPKFGTLAFDGVGYQDNLVQPGTRLSHLTHI
jgi:hypothetical protein